MKTLKMIGEYLVAGILLLLFMASLVLLTSTNDMLVFIGAGMLCTLICLGLLTKLIAEKVEERKCHGRSKMF